MSWEKSVSHSMTSLSCLLQNQCIWLSSTTIITKREEHYSCKQVLFTTGQVTTWREWWIFLIYLVLSLYSSLSSWNNACSPSWPEWYLHFLDQVKPIKTLPKQLLLVFLFSVSQASSSNSTLLKNQFPLIHSNIFLIFFIQEFCCEIKTI